MFNSLKRRVSIFLAALFVAFSILFCFSAVGLESEDCYLAEQQNTIFDLQLSASEQNEQINQYISTDLLYAQNKGNKKYPDYYGGTYIDHDNQLVVMLTENNRSLKNALKSVTNNENLKIDIVQYSYEELTNLMNIISNAMETRVGRKENHQQFEVCDNIVSYSLMDNKNRIVVQIKNIDEYKIQEFKMKITDSNAILFENIQEDIEFKASTNPGAEIKTTFSTFSTAFRVKRYTTAGEETGFITCAHGKNNAVEKPIFNKSSELLGTVKLRRFGGKYDLSYVKLSPNSSASNIIYNTNYTITGSNDFIATPITGKFVVLYGSVSGASAGYITSTNVGYKIDGISFSGMVSADLASQNGDSGGVIVSDKNGYTYKTMGVRSAGLDSGSASYFSSAKSAVNLWYLTRY